MAEYMARDLFLKNVKHNAPFIYSIVAPIALITPAADVAPVVHGRWILVDTEKWIGVCSNCNRQDRIDHLATHCRFCGARMNNA